MTPSEFYRRISILILVISSISSCTSKFEPDTRPRWTATHIPTIIGHTATPPASTQSPSLTPEFDLEDFAFPTAIGPTNKYMFYLHGKIIEDQGLPAISPEFGEYRYEEILRTLQSHGLMIISEQRPRDADLTDYALRVTRQVNDLLNYGVPPGSITVVGASKGAAIASLVSDLVSNSDVNYVLLGGCYQPMVDEWIEQGKSLSGNVLSIYDFTDEYASSCEELFAFSESTRLGQHGELVLQVGAGHGILYKPLTEWVLPTARWAKQDW